MKLGPMTSGLGFAIVITILDQISKASMMNWLKIYGPFIELTAFANLVPVWNPGISFGLLSDGIVPAWGLSAFTAIIILVLILWLRQIGHHRLSGLALGALIGGATGNLIDRLRFGAVFDFLDLHIAGWHWPAFNLADSAIVLGATGLAILSMRNSG